MSNKTFYTIIISIIAVTIITVGITYSYFTARLTGAESTSTISVTSGYLGINYTEGNENVTVTNIYPRETEWLTKTFTLTGNNTTNGEMTYEVGLNILTNNFPNGYLTYDLKVLDSTKGTPIAQKTGVPINGVGVLKFGTGTFLTGENQIHSYELKIYFKDTGLDQNAGQGKVLNAKITVAEEFNNPTWDMPNSGTLLAGIKSNRPNAVAPLTTPGVQLSTADEAVLASTEDDYGTSYYYRGAVEDNYVLFANMCWRIVRIDGRSNIKLVLFNVNPNNVSNPCEESQNGAGMAFARGYDTTSNGLEGKTTFNSTAKNANVGFMYGDTVEDNTGMTNTAAYDQEHENKYASKILTALNKWYPKFLGSEADTDYTSYLADVVWCADKSLATKSSSFNSSYTNLGYGSDKTYYGAPDRLRVTTTSTPSLICPDASGTDKDLSRFTTTGSSEGNKKLTYPIGLLTADEVTFAGARMAYSNKSFYLYANTNEGLPTGSYSWWLLSPYAFNGSKSMVSMVLVHGILDGHAVNVVYGLRPAIAIKPTITISSGDGNRNTPFVID